MPQLGIVATFEAVAAARDEQAGNPLLLFCEICNVKFFILLNKAVSKQVYITLNAN